MATEIEAIRARRAASTQGAWGWFGGLKFNDIYLATQRFGRRYVMEFRRWGMSGAQPVFQSDGTMHTLRELEQRGEIVAGKCGDHCLYEVLHPDMVFIAAAAQDVDYLLAHVDELTTDLADARERAHDVIESRLAELTARAKTAEAERDAYRKAKQENDDRFMRERDDARAERDALRRDAERVGSRRASRQRDGAAS